MPDDERRGISGLLLRDRDRDPLAALGAAAAKDGATAACLLARAKPVGAFAALIVWLVCTLHGSAPPCGEGDRYSRARMKSSRRGCAEQRECRRRSGVHFYRFQLATRIRPLLPTPGFLPVDKPSSMDAGENQKSLWITSGMVVFCLWANSANRKISQDQKGNDRTAPLGRSRRKTSISGN